MLSYLQTATLTRVPGTRYTYSNLGVAVLGYVLAKTSNKTFETLIGNSILEPLGMDSTAIHLSSVLQARKAAPHKANGTAGSEWEFGVMAPCGGMKSTVRDMMRWLAANLGSLKTTGALSSAMELAHKRFYSGSEARVCLGWHETDYGSVHALVHDGLVGGYCSFNAISLSDSTAVVILCSSASNVTNLGIDLMKILHSPK